MSCRACDGTTNDKNNRRASHLRADGKLLSSGTKKGFYVTGAFISLSLVGVSVIGAIISFSLLDASVIGKIIPCPLLLAPTVVGSMLGGALGEIGAFGTVGEDDGVTSSKGGGG